MTDKYTLYGDRGSGSAIVELALAELEIPYSFHEISLKSGSQQSDLYKKLNPQGKVPALILSDGTILTESVAILIWLLESHPGKSLLPPISTATRAKALRWLLFITADLYQLIEIYDYPDRFVEPSNCEELRQRIVAKWRDRWLLVEENIAGPYLLGDAFSITDLYIAVVSRWAHQENWRPQNIPKVELVAKTVSSRPLCKPVWTENFQAKLEST